MTKLVNLCSSCSLHANSTALSCYTINTDNTNESMIPMGGGKRWVSCRFLQHKPDIALIQFSLCSFLPRDTDLTILLCAGKWNWTTWWTCRPPFMFGYWLVLSLCKDTPDKNRWGEPIEERVPKNMSLKCEGLCWKMIYTADGSYFKHNQLIHGMHYTGPSCKNKKAFTPRTAVRITASWLNRMLVNLSCVVCVGSDGMRWNPIYLRWSGQAYWSSLG
jgi:hypothetical protein